MTARKTLPPLPATVGEFADKYFPNRFTDDALKEASRPENVGFEVGLLRVWLKEAAKDQTPGTSELVLALIDRIVKAVAVRYRLSPRSTGDLASALKAVFDGLAAIDAEVDDEEEV